MKKAWLELKNLVNSLSGDGLSDEALAVRRMSNNSKKLLAQKYAEALKVVRGEYTSTNTDKAETVEKSGENDNAADINKNTTENGGVKKQSRFDEYDKPISREDVEKLHNLFKLRKSINDFSSSEIEATQKWAYKFYQQLGNKSPFFRAWFGDWRANDSTPITVVNQKGENRGKIVNDDTGWNIGVSGKVFNESRHRGNNNQNALKYLPYINGIVKNAILLDTKTIDKPKSINSVLMHSMYTIADIGTGPELLKLYVEEMYNPNLSGDTLRAYQLQNIEKQQIGVRGSSNSFSRITQSAVFNTVSDLYSLVKQYDKDFTSGKNLVKKQERDFAQQLKNSYSLNVDISYLKGYFRPGKQNGTFR